MTVDAEERFVWYDEQWYPRYRNGVYHLYIYLNSNMLILKSTFVLLSSIKGHGQYRENDGGLLIGCFNEYHTIFVSVLLQALL